MKSVAKLHKIYQTTKYLREKPLKMLEKYTINTYFTSTYCHSTPHYEWRNSIFKTPSQARLLMLKS